MAGSTDENKEVTEQDEAQSPPSDGAEEKSETAGKTNVNETEDNTTGGEKGSEEAAVASGAAGASKAAEDPSKQAKPTTVAPAAVTAAAATVPVVTNTPTATAIPATAAPIAAAPGAAAPGAGSGASSTPSSAAGNRAPAHPPSGAPGDTKAVSPYGFPAMYPTHPYYTPTQYHPHPPSHNPMYGMNPTLNPFAFQDASAMGDPAPDTRRNRGGVTEPFPEKLHRMLENVEREGGGDVVSFFSHGRAFAIHKPRRFVTEIMPRFFRQTRLTSFQRQLNLYGFRRISQGPDNGGYYHELFLKGRPGLCVNMKRTKIKGTSKIKRDPETEPNFYQFPPIKPDPKTSGGSALPPTPHTPAVPTRQSAAKKDSGVKTQAPTGQPYPQPPAHFPNPYYMYPPMHTAPYTAAQQAPSTIYPYQPYYGYPWYPPPPIPQTPAANATQRATTPKTPQGAPAKGDGAAGGSKAGESKSAPTASSPSSKAKSASPSKLSPEKGSVRVEGVTEV